MSKTTVVVFPGLDGNPRLLDEFRAHAPEEFEVLIFGLPHITYSNYESLADHFEPLLSTLDKFILIGESFSGPLAVHLAHRLPDRIIRLVLVASFLTPPASTLAKWLPWSTLFQLPLPRMVSSYFLTGKSSHLHDALASALRIVPRKILASRVQQLLSVDVRDIFKEVECEIVYLMASQDRLISSEIAAEVSNTNHRVKIETIAAPHLVLQAEPASAWERIAKTTDKDE